MRDTYHRPCWMCRHALEDGHCDLSGAGLSTTAWHYGSATNPCPSWRVKGRTRPDHDPKPQEGLF